MEHLKLNQLAELVYQYCGLNYLTNLTSIEAKLTPRLSELSMTLVDYIKFLDADKKEWDRLVEILTINETYFYREDKQLSFFQNHLIPMLKNSTNKPIRIWSAACSTGEEPYSLAMLLHESGIISPSEVRIVGTDINKKVLKKAADGAYSKNSLSFRRIPEGWLSQFLDETEKEYRVKDTIKQMVSFEYLNLLDEMNMKKQNQLDIIFCRNVLIYFDQETTRKVASCFFDALKDGGHLFLGHAENISTMGIGFKTVCTDGTFYYRKGE